MTLAIVFQEAGNTSNRLPQVIFVRQKNKAEMVRMRPVEASTLDQQHLLCLQQLRNEGLVVLYMLNFRINLV